MKYAECQSTWAYKAVKNSEVHVGPIPLTQYLELLVDFGSTSSPSLPVVSDKVPTTSVSVRTRSWEGHHLQSGHPRKPKKQKS